MLQKMNGIFKEERVSKDMKTQITLCRNTTKRSGCERSTAEIKKK